MKGLTVILPALGLAAAAATGFAGELKRVAPAPGYAYREYAPGKVKPTGFLAEFARRQANGTTGNRKKIGYPFDQSMWEVAITNLHYADPVWRGPDRPYSKKETERPWVPYEQTGYMLDGMARLSFLTDAPAIRADYLRSLEAVLSGVDGKGRLGRWFENDTHWLEWPFLIFSRSMIAYAEGTGDRRVIDALARHYAAMRPERLDWKKREMFNIEPMLLLSEYTGDKTALEDAIKMFENSFEWKRFCREKRILEHGVTFAESLKLPAMLYLFSGDRKWLDQGERNVDDAFELNEQPDGMVSANEYLSGRDPNQGHEACVVSDLIWTLGYYVEADGRVKDADRMERIAYNALPGHSTKDFRRHQYLSFVNQAQVTPFSKSTHFAPRAKHMQYRHQLFFECCLGNIQRAFPNFVLRMWMKDVKTGAPVAMLHGPSCLKSTFDGVDFSLEEVTEYPFSDKVKFVFHAAKPVRMPLKYRVPTWAQRADAGSFAVIDREWKDGDEVEVEFPSEVKMRADRSWRWFTKGALAFSYPVPSKVEEEYPGDAFSPLSITPSAPWNWAICPKQVAAAKLVARYAPNGKYPYDESPLTLDVPAVGLQEWRVFDCNKWMPMPPVFTHPSGERTTLRLVPYGSTLARVTAFPEATPRKELPIPVAYLYDDKCYDFDPERPLADQKFAPELEPFSTKFLLADNPPQRDGDDYYDLGGHFCTFKNKLAYLVFRVWSDEDGEATFALNGAHQWQVFLDGREIARNVGIQDARLMAPEWFTGRVKKGYNYVMVKLATPEKWATYRREWGAKLQAWR